MLLIRCAAADYEDGNQFEFLRGQTLSQKKKKKELLAPENAAITSLQTINPGDTRDDTQKDVKVDEDIYSKENRTGGK